MADTTIEEIKTPAAGKHIVRKPKRRRAGLIALIVLLPLLVGGYFLWKYLGSYESTDDAQIDGHIHAISARISGHVTQVLVEDQQIVKAGEPLVVIDPRDYRRRRGEGRGRCRGRQSRSGCFADRGSHHIHQYREHAPDSAILPCRQPRRPARRAAPVPRPPSRVWRPPSRR